MSAVARNDIVTTSVRPGFIGDDLSGVAVSGPRFERTLRIRFSHCDPAGIVYFPQYFNLFNGMVEDWVTDGLGISYAELLGPRRVGLPTVSLNTEFRAISRMGDTVLLGLRVEHIGNRSLTLLLDCRDGSQERVLSRQVIVATSLDTHRAISLPPDLRAAIERFAAA